MNDAEEYRPTSDFLCSVIADEITFGDHAFGRANLKTLIRLTGDEDQTNRDWATLLLVQTGLDGADIRAALRERLDDPFEDVRLEALIGVAQREPSIALPVVERLLDEDPISSLVLEAAAFVADPVLVPALQRIAESWRDNEADALDQSLTDAIAACVNVVQPEWRDTD